MLKRAGAGIVVALSIVSAAQAVTVNNLTSSTLLFKDDFENPAVTPTSAHTYDATIDADPIATTGSWGVFEDVIDGGGEIQVLTAPTSPDPLPFQGNRDLRLYRESAHEQHDLRLNLSSVQSTSGDVIHTEMMVYLPSATNTVARAQFILSGPSLNVNGGFHTSRAWVYNSTDGFVHTIGPGESDTTTSVPYLTDVWQKWTMDYAVGGSTFTFSVDGVGGSGNSFSTGDVYGMEIINGSNSPAGSFYLDGVPEPASLTLLATGAASVLRRRTRQACRA